MSIANQKNDFTDDELQARERTTKFRERMLTGVMGFSLLFGLSAVSLKGCDGLKVAADLLKDSQDAAQRRALELMEAARHRWKLLTDHDRALVDERLMKALEIVDRMLVLDQNKQSKPAEQKSAPRKIEIAPTKPAPQEESKLSPESQRSNEKLAKELTEEIAKQRSYGAATALTGQLLLQAADDMMMDEFEKMVGKRPTHNIGKNLQQIQSDLKELRGLVYDKSDQAAVASALLELRISLHARRVRELIEMPDRAQANTAQLKQEMQKLTDILGQSPNNVGAGQKR